MVVHRPVIHQEIDNYTRIGSLEIQKGRPSLALDAFQIAYKRSLQTDAKALQTACAFNLGATCVAAGHPERGLAVLRTVANEREDEQMPDLFYNMAIAYELMKERTEMVKCLEKAFRGYQLQGNMINVESDIALKLALHYENSRNWDEAAGWHSRCAELLHRQHRPVARLRTMTRQAECGLKAGNAHSSKELLSIITQVLCQIEDRPSRARIYTEVGLVHMHLGEMKEATACLRAALPFIDTVKDPSLEAALHQNLGAALNVNLNFEESLQHHRSAIAKYGNQRNRASQGHCFANLGFALGQLARPDEAREAYLHAQQAAFDAGDKRSQWQCFEALGVLHFNAGEYDKSVDHFQRALTVCGGNDGSEKERDAVIAKLRRAIEQHQNTENLRNNPYLKESITRVERKEVSEEEISEEESESEESIEQVPVDPKVAKAMQRIGGLARGSKKWNPDATDGNRYIGRKSTNENLFTNPKRHRVLLFDEAVIQPVDKTKRGKKKKFQILRQKRTVTDGDDESLTSVTTESDADDDDRKDVRQKYKEVLTDRPGGIAETANRIADLARQYQSEVTPKRPMTAYGRRGGVEEEEETEDSSDDSGTSDGSDDSSSTAKEDEDNSVSPEVPEFPGTAQLEPVGTGTSEQPVKKKERAGKGGDFIDFFGGDSLDETYEKIGTTNLQATTKSEAEDPAYAQVPRLGDTSQRSIENEDTPPVPPRMNEMTRAERERVLYEKHRELIAQQQQQETELPTRAENPKKSCACILM